MILFNQDNFLGGLNVELDQTKTPPDSYPLLVNGRARRNVIEPTHKHLQLDAPEGVYQGLYVAGSFTILFVSGIAYYADITASPIAFHPIANWTAMSSSSLRIYAEIVPATTNFFNTSGIPQLAEKAFNNLIASYSQALFVFDGVISQAILPNGSARVLKNFNEWTTSNPEYVPAGLLPAVLNNKLFLVSPDRLRIYHSVSGRASDFVVNITASGDKGGDAETVATSVSYNEITGIRPLSSGQLLVTTLFASYTLELDYENTIFGEPYLIPTFLFPVGCVNELSSVDILDDVAIITQTGIQSFNAVAQTKKESNNFPLGAPIRGLLSNPQSNTCTVNHDDYALFAVNTIHGQGVLTYDTLRGKFQSLDLSFGHVKQFANTRISGAERLFFITHDNKIYEAFADEDINSTRLYLGEWTPDKASSQTIINSIDLVFGTVRTSGQCKISVYSDREFIESSIFEVSCPGFTEHVPIPIPFVDTKQVASVNYGLKSSIRAWKIGILIEWNFNAALTNVSINGRVETAANVELIVQPTVSSETFAVVADTGYDDELNPGGTFLPEGLAIVDVVKGTKYYFDSNGDGPLVTGNIKITSGLFTALDNKVVIEGTASGAMNFTLRTAENYQGVLAEIYKLNPLAIIGAGDHSYPAGSALDVKLGLASTRIPFHAVAGNHDIDTSLGKYFYAKLGIPRYYSKAFSFVEFFFYNGGWTTANVGVNSSGITTGATSEPDGNDASSLQFAWLKSAIAQSTARFKIVVVHEPPYTSDLVYSPGYAELRLPFKTIGAHAVISGHGHNMERRVVDGFPYFVCGTGGADLRGFKPNTENISAFRDSDHYGYLKILSDPLTCFISFVSVEGEVLDSFALYV